MSDREIRSIPLDLIYPDEEMNCRGRIAAIDVTSLAKDIESKGMLIQPITVAPFGEESKERALKRTILPDSKDKIKKSSYLLIAGYRRYMAHRILEWPKIDATILTKEMTDTDARIFNLTENIQRKDLDILQEAKAIDSIYRSGMTRQQIADRLGVSPGWVQIRCMLLELPNDVQGLVQTKVIKQDDIRQLYTVQRKHGEEAVFDMAKQMKERVAKGQSKATVRLKGKIINAKRQRKKAEIFELMTLLRETFGNGLHTRALAWAAGEITDIDLYKYLENEAKQKGLTFQNPMVSQ